MTSDELVIQKIESLNPKGGLGETALHYLARFKAKHPQVSGHLVRVALAADETARRLGTDNKAAFFAGLLHDVGKLDLPPDLFNDREISEEEYEAVKTHAKAGYEELRSRHSFIAYCAGMHHARYQAGYGLKLADFPATWGPETIEKVLEITTIVSICDFVDAYHHRTTALKVSKGASTLKDLLLAKFPNDRSVIEAVLGIGDQ